MEGKRERRQIQENEKRGERKSEREKEKKQKKILFQETEFEKRGCFFKTVKNNT